MPATNRKTKKQIFLHWLPFYLMGLPGLIYLFINNYMPMVGLQIAFKNFNYAKGMWNSSWIGFKNFEFLFKSSDAFVMIRNTLLYNILWIFLGMFIGVAAAILINEITNRIARQFYQTVILLPYLMSMVVVAYLVYAYLAPSSGLVTNIVKNVTGTDPQFYQESKYWPFILTFVSQWRGIGFGMILYLSNLLGIDPGFYEAASRNNDELPAEPLRMSRLTENLLRGIDYDRVRQRRSENFLRLHEALGSVNALPVRPAEGAFAYPLLLEKGSAVRRALIAEKIFVPTLWPNVLREQPEGSAAYRLAANILPLPCDQRYGAEEMAFVAETVLRCLRTRSSK